VDIDWVFFLSGSSAETDGLELDRLFDTVCDKTVQIEQS